MGTILGRQWNFLFSLFSVVLLIGCHTPTRQEQIEAAAKDWCTTIRGCQVIPIYPLDEDIHPGDVFLVDLPISRQQEIYDTKGYLPVNNPLTRIHPTNYPNFYGNSFVKSTNILPADWIRPNGSLSNAWQAAPHAAFPSYSFSIRKGKGINLAFPIQGVPVGLSLLSSDAADGTLILKDARTIGIDTMSLYDQLQQWAAQRRAFLANYGTSPDNPRKNFLRVVTRVYCIGSIDLSLRSSATRSSGMDVGTAKPVNLLMPEFGAGTNVSSEVIRSNYVEGSRVLQEVLSQALTNKDSFGNLLPGGSLRITAASSRAISMKEQFSPPLIVGYIGFDCQIEPGGILGPVVPTQGVLENEKPLPLSDSYIVQKSEYVVDFRPWIPVETNKLQTPVSPVEITRRDSILKVSDTPEPYVIPYYTSGVKIDCFPKDFPLNASPLFKPIIIPGDVSNLKSYQFELPLGKEAKGYKTEIENKFTFWNGFRNLTNEDWSASVKYPTQVLRVRMLFPPHKPCKKVKISRIEGIAAPVPLTNEVVNFTQNNEVVEWTGTGISGNTRMRFDFDW